LAYRTTRVTISGVFLGGLEEWSTGFWIGENDADADLPTQQLADDIRTAWQTWFTSQAAYISNAYTSTLVKLSSVGTDGKSDANDTVYSTFTGNAAGARAELLPPQIALVATFQGPQARGLASKGRMYLPGVVRQIGVNGKIDGTTQASMLAAFRTMLQAINASTATDNVLMLASHGQLNRDGTVKVGGRAAVNHEVVSVKIGDVYDTQRRRRNGLVEVYQTATL
jgi:hypothetical protein